MNAAELNNSLQQAGLHLCLIGTDQIKLVGPKSKVTPQVVAKIRAHKGALIAYFLRPEAAPSAQQPLRQPNRTDAAHMAVYRVVLDGKATTMITPANQTLEQISDRVRQQFSQYHVDCIEPHPFTRTRKVEH